MTVAPLGETTFVLSGIAVAQISPDISDAEFKCQQNNNKAAGKYVAAVTKCSSKCLDAFYKQKDGANAEDCYSPFGGTTATCVDDPILLKGANNKFAASIKKKCDPATKDTSECPACYDLQGGNNGCGDAGYAGTQVQNILNQVTAFGPGVFCKTTGAVGKDPTAKAEAKCQLNTAKNLAKLVGSINKCFDKCFKNASKGLLPASDCAPAPVLPADSPTQDCLAAAGSKATMKVDQLCTTAGVNLQCPQFCTSDSDCDTGPPDGICTNFNCSAGNLATHPYFNGSVWVTLVTNAIAGNVPDTYCSE